MSVKSRLCSVTTLAAALALLLPAVARGQVTYQNDSLASEGDGVVSCGFVVGEKFAAIFVPEAGDVPFLIDEVQLMLSPYQQEGTDCVEATPRDSVSVTVEIWNDAAPSVDPDTAPVYQSSEWSVASSATTLNALKISDDQDVLVESGVVKVAITIPELDTMPVRDIDGITTERNLIYDNTGTWRWAEDLGVTGDWLLRLVVIPQGSDEADAVELSPDATEDPAGDAADVSDDVPADVQDDAPADAEDDEPDGRLGGGGCSCAQVAPVDPFLPLCLLLICLAVLRLARRN